MKHKKKPYSSLYENKILQYCNAVNKYQKRKEMVIFTRKLEEHFLVKIRPKNNEG